MKKSLLAVALLGTFAASAFAAPSVTLYGRIDTGLVYTHQDLDQPNKDATDTFEMKSGWSTGSRWGLKGTEDLGKFKVGFVLENGFNGDDGTDAQTGRMFGREALVSVSGAYGTLYAGRMLTLASDGGSLGMLGAVHAFGNSYGDATMKGNTGSAFNRYDNTLAYATPTFGGFSAKAMYSFKGTELDKDGKKVDGTENKADADRYAAVGLQYKAGNFTGVMTGEYTMWSNTAYKDLDDGYNILVGGNYNFGVATAYAFANYFDNSAADYTDTFKLIKATGVKALKGWGANLGVKAPALGGNVMATVGYRDAKDATDETDTKFQRWNAAVGYTYAFSKRTNIYGAVTYAQEKGKNAKVATNNRTPNETQVGFGLVHKF